MDQETIQNFKEDFSLLIEAGFVAVKQLDETSATRIFHAAQALSPNNTAPQIGLGYIALNKLEIKEATRIFESVVQVEPENHLAQTFLGMCFLLTKGKHKKGEKIIQEAMEKTTDPTIKNLGAISLEWAEKDLSKKNKAPFFAQQTQPSESED
ncbi:tetratricopeptide repeat protein [Candidatus Protochlamydia phocaeensis]|uniref:tetratricopeptide repeat protein n=1 Tax=Candidatus Protochlamydia phocaeensis TaxID=1414722 RepID=UPI000839187F|nr:HrpB1 family type III secretion system apparatus protein [Candidatus Protochlamydia phocaeensis]